jgi:hypothetical protein
MIDCGCDEILLPQGSNGVDGKNAFTVTTASFPQPAVGSPAAITVSDTLQNTNQWAIPGQVIRITDASGNGGWYQVVSITGTTQISATNLGYTGSSPSPTTIAIGAKVSPAGLQGPQGDPGSPGATGDTGPANQLSIGTVSTVTPGNPATATITGSAPNQTLNLGIPSGLSGTSGKTLQFQLNSNSATSVTGTSYIALVPSSTIDTSGDLCPNDGDAFRVVFFCTTYATLKNDGGYNIQIQLGYDDGVSPFVNTNIEYTGTGVPAFEAATNMWGMPLSANSNTPSAPKSAFKFEMIVQRLTSTTARCSVEFQANTGFDQKVGLYSTNISYNFASTTTKKIQVNIASVTASETSTASRWTILIEKITK